MKTAKMVVIWALAFVVSLTTGVAKAKLVACIGSSQTTGVGLPNPAYNCYPAQLERLLRRFDVRWKTRGFGINGATVLRRGDIPYVSQGAYHQAIASEPDVVIFHFGPNASRSPNRQYIQTDFVSDYASLIDDFSQLPSQPDIWVCIPTVMLVSGYTISPAIMREQINPLTVEIAHEKGVPVIDLYTAFKDAPELYQTDQIHLNAKGAQLMAEIVASVILGFRFSPDFNGDWKVDIEDLIMLIEHWGQDEPSVDIVPAPFGDGIVDRADLEVLMAYWGQEINDPTLIAHWALDETEGNIAYDSAGELDGSVYGEPLWQPAAGMVGGALEFDGIDDYVSTPFVLNPADGVFSVVAWIKGTTPGQVILSQIGVANWLLADPSGGNLMTDLKGTSRSGKPLQSQTNITDGQWHRIGLVWDGSFRTLYVDGVAVAEDTQDGLEGSDGGLYIGADKSLDSASFFFGLIDDVRIYNNVLSAEEIAALAQ